MACVVRGGTTLGMFAVPAGMTVVRVAVVLVVLAENLIIPTY